MKAIPFHIEFGALDSQRSAIATDTTSCYFWDDASNVVVLRQTTEQLDKFNGKRRKQEQEHTLAPEQLPAHVRAKLDGLRACAP